MTDLDKLQKALRSGDDTEICKILGITPQKVEREEPVDESRPKIDCACCHEVIPYDKHGFLNRCVRISRGDFRLEDGTYQYEDENVKFGRFLCSRCFLEDEDLCRFFNKLGLRVR